MATDTPLLIVRIAQLLAKRGCAIRKLVVTPIENHQVTIALTILQSSAIPQTQIISQIHKLIDVDSVAS
jgi:acetolactate synthase small subunit